MGLSGPLSVTTAVALRRPPVRPGYWALPHPSRIDSSTSSANGTDR